MVKINVRETGEVERDESKGSRAFVLPSAKRKCLQHVRRLLESARIFRHFAVGFSANLTALVFKKKKPETTYTIPITKTKKLILTGSELELYLKNKAL